MAKYHLTNKAVEDLADIWNYTFEEWSEKQANNYYALLLDLCRELAENAGRGKKYDIIAQALLGHRSNEHIIFYKVISIKEIEVVRILHGRMDLKTKL